MSDEQQSPKYATIVFTRHGETQYNKDNLLTGHHDPHLTEKGLKQAEKAGKALCSHELFQQDKTFMIVASNMTRTNQTADKIKRELEYHFNINIDISYHPGLKERHSGALEGKPLSHALPIIRALEDHQSHPEHGGESIDIFTKRITKTMCELFHLDDIDIVIAAAHGFSGVIASTVFMEHPEGIHLGNSEFLVFHPHEVNDLVGKCKGLMEETITTEL